MTRGSERSRAPRGRAALASASRTPSSPGAPRQPPIPLRHPAWWLAGAVAALVVLLSVTFVIFEKDFWQHLAVGRALWQLGHVPTTHIWTWPTYGEPAITPSWGFRLA